MTKRRSIFSKLCEFCQIALTQLEKLLISRKIDSFLDNKKILNRMRTDAQIIQIFRELICLLIDRISRDISRMVDRDSAENKNFSRYPKIMFVLLNR